MDSGDDMNRSFDKVGSRCSHKKRYRHCHVCQMLTFLFCRKFRPDWPFLIRDVCTLIFKALPVFILVPPPPKDGFYELEHCGLKEIVRVPITTNLPQEAICGIQYRKCDVEHLLYCRGPAVKQGVCGTWTCSKHGLRKTADMNQSELRPELKTLKGVNYTH